MLESALAASRNVERPREDSRFQPLYQIEALGHESIGDHMQYRFRVTHRLGLSWCIARRYSALSKLYDALKAEFGSSSLPPFPEKTFAPSMFLQLDPEFLQRRMRELTRFLCAIVEQEKFGAHLAVQRSLGVICPEVPGGVRVHQPEEGKKSRGVIIEIRPGVAEAAPVDKYRISIQEVVRGSEVQGRRPFCLDVMADGTERPQRVNLINLRPGDYKFSISSVNGVGTSDPVCICARSLDNPAPGAKPAAEPFNSMREQVEQPRQAESSGTAERQQDPWNSGPPVPRPKQRADGQTNGYPCLVPHAPSAFQTPAHPAVTSSSRPSPNDVSAATSPAASVEANPAHHARAMPGAALSGSSASNAAPSAVAGLTPPQGLHLQGSLASALQPHGASWWNQPGVTNQPGVQFRQAPQASRSPETAAISRGAVASQPPRAVEGGVPSMDHTADQRQRVNVGVERVGFLIQPNPPQGGAPVSSMNYEGPGRRQILGPHGNALPENHDNSAGDAYFLPSFVRDRELERRQADEQRRLQAANVHPRPVRVEDGRIHRQHSAIGQPSPVPVEDLRREVTRISQQRHAAPVPSPSPSPVINHAAAARVTTAYGVGAAPEDACKRSSAGSAPSKAAVPVDDSGEDCSICLAAPKSHAFVPCGHRCVCSDCAAEVIRSAQGCPLCRAPVTTSLQIFT